MYVTSKSRYKCAKVLTSMVVVVVVVVITLCVVVVVVVTVTLVSPLEVVTDSTDKIGEEQFSESGSD